MGRQILKKSQAVPTRSETARRKALVQAASLGALAIAAPRLLTSAQAQGDDLAPYRSAKIDWRQVAGEAISIAVIPASYFDNLGSLVTQFEALTGIKVRIEKVPPGQIRQKAMLDLSSKTRTYATHAADPMYYPLYVANKWVDPLDRYLNDASLTDPAWFNYDDIIKAWRDADSIDGKPYGIPYDGEVTVQVYRKDLYDAKGLKPAETLDELLANAKALHDPANRVYGLALRGFAGAGQNMYIYPSLLRAFGGSWSSGSGITVNSPEAVRALQWYVDALTQLCAAGGAQLELAGHRRCLLARDGRVLHRRPLFRRSPEQPGKIQGHRQDRLCPLAEGTDRQAGHVDLELGLSDQCRPRRARQEGHVAVHHLGSIRGDPGAHVMEICRTGQALRGEPHLAVALGGLRQRDEGLGRQLRQGGHRFTRAGHRRRVASPGAAMARYRRDHGNRHPVGAGRTEEAEGSPG